MSEPVLDPDILRSRFAHANQQQRADLFEMACKEIERLTASTHAEGWVTDRIYVTELPDRCPTCRERRRLFLGPDCAKDSVDPDPWHRGADR